MQNLSSFTSITYSLPPSMSNLVNVEVRWFMSLIYFEVVTNKRLSRIIADFFEVFVSESLIGQGFHEQPIKNAVSYHHYKQLRVYFDLLLSARLDTMPVCTMFS